MLIPYLPLIDSPSLSQQNSHLYKFPTRKKTHHTQYALMKGLKANPKSISQPLRTERRKFVEASTFSELEESQGIQVKRNKQRNRKEKVSTNYVRQRALA